MPNTKSAKKRLRQNVVRRARTRSSKSALKTQVKKVLTALKEGNAEQAEAEFKVAAAKLDRAAAHRLIHRNLAARKKSRLQHRIKALKEGHPLPT